MSQATLTKAASLVLEHAAKIGLPEPQTVRTYAWSYALHLDFKAVADLAEWARYCETQIAEHEARSGWVHYSIGESAVLVTVLDMPIQAWCLVSAAKRAEQSA